MHVINDVKQLEDYKKVHPVYYPVVKENFKRDLAKGEVILVNSKGGYCHVMKGHFEIVKYL